ncbi:MAG: hypothetical protein H0T79_04285 [Deltaproteobacteria bacterium]|nr:hypothetical protein [Deltaproteobacteria bacterium]
MRRAPLLLLLVASTAGADIPVDELAVLRDPTQKWSYELVGGAALDTLAPIPKAARVTCGVADVTATQSRIVCDPPATPGSPLLALVLGPRTLVFDDAGVRELRGDATPEALADRANARALTFPRQPPTKVKVDVRPWANGSTRIETRTETRRARGAERTVWISEVTTTDRTTKAPAVTAAIYAPGIGPLLLCRKQMDLKPAYVCLRLIVDSDSGTGMIDVVKEPAPKPIPRVTLTRKLARNKTSLTADKLASKVLSAYLPGIRRCYAMVVAKQPAATGTLAFVFTVNAIGKTEDIAVKSFDPTLTTCATKVAASWRFPIPVSEYAEPLATRYELEFKLVVK